MVFTTQQFLLVCLSVSFLLQVETISNYLSIIVDMIFVNTLSLKELLTYETACYHVLLTLSGLIVSRLTLMNSGVVEMSITTINVILPEKETEALVINSCLSILIEKS